MVKHSRKGASYPRHYRVDLRTAALLAGVGGVVAVARADEPVFRNVADNVGGSNLTGVSQLVIQTGGRVAAVVRYDDGDTTSIIYRQVPTDPVSVIATAGVTPIYNETSPPFDSFAGLAMTLSNSNVLLTFSASPGKDGNSGIYQADITMPATPATYRLISTGDSVGSYDPFTITEGAGFQIDSRGNVVVGGMGGSVDPKDLVVRANSTGASILADSSAPPALSGFNENPNIPGFKKVLTRSNSSNADVAVFLAEKSGAPAIVEASSASAAPTRFGVETHLNLLITPQQLIGATQKSELFAASFTSDSDPDNYGVFFHRKEANNTDTVLRLASFTGPEAPAVTLIPGMMTAGGRAAFIVPDSGGNPINQTLYYFDNDTVRPVASHGTAVGDTGRTINFFSIVGASAPMVNDRYWVVFDALLDDGSGAILAWNQADPDMTPTLIARENSDMTVLDDLGVPHTVHVDFLDGFYSNNAYGFDASTFKSFLSADNYLSFAIHYNDGETERTQIVITQLPEPSTLLLGTSALFGLSLRRQRKRN